MFTPGWKPPGTFTALFVGKLIPLHGLDTILAAARIAPELPFRVVAAASSSRCSRTGRRTWSGSRGGWYELLPAELKQTGCALGIFASSPKAQRVIPNKVFQALACGAPW